MTKAKVAVYWAGSCGGCDIAILDIHEALLPLLDKVDFVFWPCVMDVKFSDVENMPDKYMDICFFNGAIRNSENRHMAELLRKKSKTLVAFGSCSAFGGIPALSNLFTKNGTFKRAYMESESTVNETGVWPGVKTEIGPYKLELPEIYDTVLKLSDVTDVDYIMPGCPPVPEQIKNVIGAVLEGNLPKKGETVGAGGKNLCEECPRVREEKKIKRFYRPQELEHIDHEKCLLDQGLLCLGPATRSGCGAQCPAANMGCRGCYGPLPGVKDQGLKFLSAIASVIDSKDEKEMEEIINTIVAPAGTFYRFTMADSLLKRKGGVKD